MAKATSEVPIDPALVPPLDESLLTLDDEEKKFLHSSVTPDDVELKRRILEVQTSAYQQQPYPCIRGFHFVKLFMHTHPVYPEVLTAGKAGRTIFLDLGCCMGNEVRKLVCDGYPRTKVTGSDLRQEFIEHGYGLFQDKGQCTIHFFASDIFEMPYPFPADQAPAGPLDIGKVTEMKQLYGKVDHIYAGMFFHLFDESTQYALALRVALLLKRKAGTVVFGRHQGLEEAGYIDDPVIRYDIPEPDVVWMVLNLPFNRQRYGHSVKSWHLLWKKVFSEVESPEFAESKVVVEASLSEPFDPDVLRAHGPTRVLFWSIKIV
ncbi:uncharacterized protein PHACADRAFT_197643 [Phanerochaete carnosa HHB-10118-sp]|uniref:Methyltransferase domain-containing protein n=1 Tax=Phanerochaete carnosa (strain HHB-10118-sp) TaxID=650164 RepID=K5W278_PHACS|nr:uncharacterized protein PHACADRAFT_197643 [Phanerochaete carnosa HHB-10118-sp]EKM53220.1 hypothetical protein PHACADRAFT_197643 [Phanerochaete carnosa HHB-10118-sp]